MEKKYVVRLMLGLLLGGLLISGCVSLKAYKGLKNRYNRETAKFEEHRLALAKSNRTLQRECNELTIKSGATEAESQNLKSKMRATDEAMAKLREDIIRRLRGVPGIITTRGGIEIEGKVLFSPGRAILKETGKEVLAKIAEDFKRYPNRFIRIEGHTDSDPITESRQRWTTGSNFELAAYRALKILLYFEERGIDPARMYLASFGQYQPKAPNDSPENKAKNRRVVIGFEEIIIEEEPGEGAPRK